MTTSRFVTCIFCAVLMLPPAVSADLIVDWNNVALDAIRENSTSPPEASRTLAMLHVSMFNAVNATNLTYQAYHSYQTAIPGSSAEAAAAAAARDILAYAYPSSAGLFDIELAASIAPIPDGAAKTNGLALGQATAGDILAWRANDNSNLIVPYTPSDEPGKWRPTPPGYLPAALPNWGLVTPFAMSYGSEFRGPGPPPLDSVEYATYVNETKSLGRVDSADRTPYQTETALFWADGAGTATPPGHWNVIAQGLVEQQGNSLLERARLFALLNMSMADAGISSWDNKYTYNLWRPITAIQLADTDGNPLTDPDPTWTPLLTTPNFPENTSGHSTFSGAAAQLLADFYGTDDLTFSATSEGVPGVTRTYTSFTEAADEVGRSRVYGGIHFTFSDTPAIALGRQVGSTAFAHNMQPIPETSTFALAVMSGLCGLASMGRRWLGRLKQLRD